MNIGCLDFLCDNELYYIEGDICNGSPEFFEIACMPEIKLQKVKNEFKNIEEARDYLRLESIKCIEKEINRKMELLEEYGCKNIQVNYRTSIESLSADTPNEFKIGMVSYAIVAISGEKTGNIKIFGFKK